MTATTMQYLNIIVHSFSNNLQFKSQFKSGNFIASNFFDAFMCLSEIFTIKNDILVCSTEHEIVNANPFCHNYFIILHGISASVTGFFVAENTSTFLISA